MDLMSRRATDAERQTVRSLLSDAHVAGMITEQEWKERVDRTADMLDIEELQSLYSDVTGSSIPTIALTVTKDWYMDAGRMVQTCEDMARDRFIYGLWWSIPIAFLVAIVSGTSPYGPTWPIWAALVYVIIAYLAIGISFFHTDHTVRKMRKLLKDVGVE